MFFFQHHLIYDFIPTEVVIVTVKNDIRSENILFKRENI